MAKENQANNLIDKVVSLCKRRGFVFPGSEIYGGLANAWDFGPMGVELKNNIKSLWWERFVRRRDDIAGLDSAIIMNTKVWENSGHLKEFSDPLAECKKCHQRFRLDELKEKKCPNCKGELAKEKQFNLMFETNLGPVEGNSVYLRPETAQGIFVDFKNVLDVSRKKIPFGVAQIGKAFRNEITPGNFIFRTREFEQMEIEYFIEEKSWQDAFEMWRGQMWQWIENDLGLNKENVHELEVSKEELAHYSKRTIDFEYDFPFGRKELYGLAYRGDFDLKNHFKEPPYKNQNPPAGGNESFYPHVIEPTFGVERSVLAVLLDAYSEDGDRIFLKLKPRLAPFKAAVFPLLANKPELVDFAKKVYEDLKDTFAVTWDDRGNIGKRYYAQDEIGTPFCLTVDFDSLENNDITVRDRDTAKQERVKIEELPSLIQQKLKN